MKFPQIWQISVKDFFTKGSDKVFNHIAQLYEFIRDHLLNLHGNKRPALPYIRFVPNDSYVNIGIPDNDQDRDLALAKTMR